jgi:hypothetical protein
MIHNKTVIAASGLLAIAICLIVISRNSGNTGDPSLDAAHPYPGKSSPAGNASRHRDPFQVPRLTAAEESLLKADPTKAVGANPDDLDFLVAWAALDPSAALAWVDQQVDHRQSRENLLGAIAAGILIKEGQDAMDRFLADHEQDPGLLPKYQSKGALLRHAMLQLGRNDSSHSALEILRSSSDAALAGFLVLGTPGDSANMTRAIDYLEAKGILVEVDYWSFQSAIDADPRYWADWALERDSELLTDIAQAWSRKHAEEMQIWLDDRIPTSDPRRVEIDKRLSL